MREESVKPSRQTETDEDGNSRRILVSLDGNHSLGGGVAFNLVASSLEPQANAPVETEKEEEEEKFEKRESAPVAVAEAVSGVRKKLLIPAEEALDSARVAAELVVKDAMEATQQRLMEILHRNSSSQAPPAADELTKRWNGGWQVGGWGRRERRQCERISLRGGRFAAIIPGDSVAETVISSGIFNFLNIYNTLLVARLILTWFPDPPAIIANPLSTICDPYLNIFRGIIPPLGGTLDLSPILAFLALDVFTNTATALPCELPSSTPTTKNPSGNHSNWRQLVQMKKVGLRSTKRDE